MQRSSKCPVFITSIAIGALAAIVCYFARSSPRLYPGPGDFNWALNEARDLLSGQDPYAFTPDPIHIPYPLPVAFFGLPWLWAPPILSASIHFGLSSALLAFGILQSGKTEKLVIFLSFPYVFALLFAQWSPLITATWFFPVLSPLLVLVKPQTALPVALTRFRWSGFLLALAVLLISLILDPTWPWRWKAMLGPYQQLIPILTPLGLPLLLALLRWRNPKARLLLLMALMPFRGTYDLTPLHLVPNTRYGTLSLVLLGWIVPLLDITTGFMSRPMWTLPLLFLPSLVLVLTGK